MKFIKDIICFLIILLVIPSSSFATPRATPDSVRAKEVSDMHFGMFICWSYSTFSGKEWTGEPHDVSFFSATACNTDQWVRTAKDAGMKYILFLTKHHDGFCLWDTETTDLKVTNAPLGTDVLKQLQASCEKYGIKLALYFSEGDWNWPGAERGQSFKGGYNPELKKTQLKELLTGYGPIEFIWFDNAVGDGGLSHKETTEWVHKFQPDCFVGYNCGEPSGRLSLRERGYAGPLGGDNLTWVEDAAKNEKGYDGYLVAEFTYPILPAHEGGADWFYSLPQYDSLCHSAEKIYKDYLEAVKYGNIFSLDVGPDYNGEIREIDRRVLHEVGRMIRERTTLEAQEENPFATTIRIAPDDTPEKIIDKAVRVVPDHRQFEALKNEYIAFACYGPNSFTRREWGTGLEDPKLFAPSGLDTDQWVRTMKDAGMTMVILTAKHHDGFVLWQSRYTDHGVMSTDFMDGKADIMRSLAESCRKYGMKLGVYLSPADLHEIESPDGRYGNLSPKTLRKIPRQVEGRPFENKTTFEFEVDDYNEYFLNQLFELLTEYGPIYEVWFDGAHPKRKGGQTYDYAAWKKLIYTLAPEAVVFGREGTRWCGNEAGETRQTEWNVIPYPANPDTMTVFPDLMADDLGSRERLLEGKYLHYHPAETDVSIRDGWFYRDDDKQHVRTPDNVFDMYERAVGGNSILLLNIPPNRSGRFSPRDSMVITEVGRRIRDTYSHNLLNGSDAPKSLLDTDLTSVVSIDSLIVITLPQSVTFNRIMLQEPVADSGERIEEHAVDAWIDGKWRQIAEATNIGYKRILRFPDVTSNRIRIRVVSSRAEPYLTSIGAYCYRKPDNVYSEALFATPQFLDRDEWTVRANSQLPGNPAHFAIDSDLTSYWCAPSDSARLTIDLKKPHLLNGLVYTPQTIERGRGMIARARVLSSQDERDWSLIGEMEFGNLVNDPSPRRYDFPETVNARFLRIEVVETEGQSTTAAVAEMNLF